MAIRTSIVPLAFFLLASTAHADPVIVIQRPGYDRATPQDTQQRIRNWREAQTPPSGRDIRQDNVRAYQQAEEELIQKNMPPAEPALTRKDLEEILDAKLADSAKKKPDPAPTEPAESTGFGGVGGIGGIGNMNGMGPDTMDPYAPDDGGFVSIPTLGGQVPGETPDVPAVDLGDDPELVP